VAKLNYKQYGEQGPAILILHGIFGMLDNWHNIAKKLSEKYTVYSLDARNHGQSPHTEVMGFESMGEDVIEFADDHGLNGFILMGHSMGGKTAMWVAQHYPERISKLVVVDIAPKAYKPGHLPYFEALKGVDWSLLNTRKEVDEALMQYEQNMGIRLFLAKNIERREAGGYEVKSNIPAIESAYEEIIGALQFTSIYKGPTLFILGAESRYLKEEDKPYIEAHFPDADYQLIEGAGHWVHADNPVQFLDVLTKFLA
jgi:pimeloyl-ACP methyl ester carboxylesterase